MRKKHLCDRYLADLNNTLQKNHLLIKRPKEVNKNKKNIPLKYYFKRTSILVDLSLSKVRVITFIDLDLPPVLTGKCLVSREDYFETWFGLNGCLIFLKYDSPEVRHMWPREAGCSLRSLFSAKHFSSQGC